MQGRVKFYLPKKKYGIITCPDGREVFFNGRQFIAGEPQQDHWVDFQEAVIDYSGRFQATQIVPIECPSEFRLTGVVDVFDPKKFGFIKYPKNRLFFHLQDVIDDPQIEPVVGCLVEFEIGQRLNKRQAINVRVLEWPEQSIEDYFLSTERESEQ